MKKIVTLVFTAIIIVTALSTTQEQAGDPPVGMSIPKTDKLGDPPVGMSSPIVTLGDPPVGM